MRKLSIPVINIGLLIVLILVIGFFLFVPVNPLKINSVTIDGDNFKAGGEMSFTIDRCKYVSDSVPGTATRYFVNEQDSTKPDIFISSTDDLGDKGCATIHRKMDIPSHIKDGTYRLKFVTRYYPSVLREPTTIEYVTNQTFTVKGQELSAQLESINQQLKEINARSPGVVVNTLIIPTPQTITPPFQEPEPTPEPQPVQPVTPTPEQACIVNIIGIKLLCN